MVKTVIFGNSGSGKTTLARVLSNRYQAEHLDLDTIAWSEKLNVRATFQASQQALMQFIENSGSWVIEGCYASLLREATVYCTELIFLNPGIEACVKNCQARPWEPHKYDSRDAQEANLQMLIEWVRNYETRNDEFSLQAHQKLFDQHQGIKVEYRSNEETAQRARPIEPVPDL